MIGDLSGSQFPRVRVIVFFGIQFYNISGDGFWVTETSASHRTKKSDPCPEDDVLHHQLPSIIALTCTDLYNTSNSSCYQ
jgi:chitinase